MTITVLETTTEVIIRNTGDQPIFIGKNGLSKDEIITTGDELDPGDSITLPGAASDYAGTPK